MKKRNRISILLLSILFTLATTGICIAKPKPERTYTTKELCETSGGVFEGDEIINSCCWKNPPQCEFCQKDTRTGKNQCNVVKDTGPGRGGKPRLSAPQSNTLAPTKATTSTPAQRTRDRYMGR